MQNILNTWLEINIALFVIWGFVIAYHLTFNAGKGDSEKELKSLLFVHDFAIIVVLMFVGMTVASLALGIMPSVIN